MRALADTSLFVAREAGRPLRSAPPDELLVSVVSVAELRAGVLGATTTLSRADRLVTLRAAESLEPLLVDDLVADAWARLRVALRDTGRRMPVNDSWIAATALGHGLPVATQDDNYDDTPGLVVLKL